jgi:hypothetical protein
MNNEREEEACFNFLRVKAKRKREMKKQKHERERKKKDATEKKSCWLVFLYS